MSANPTLAELIVGIRHQVQKSLEYSKYAEEARVAGRVAMTVTELDIELPITLEQAEVAIDSDALMAVFEEMTAEEKARAWLGMPMLDPSLQLSVDVAATQGSSLEFDGKRALEIERSLAQAFTRADTTHEAAAEKPVRRKAGKAKPAEPHVLKGKTLQIGMLAADEASQAGQPSPPARLRISFKASLR